MGPTDEGMVVLGEGEIEMVQVDPCGSSTTTSPSKMRVDLEYRCNTHDFSP